MKLTAQTLFLLNELSRDTRCPTKKPSVYSLARMQRNNKEASAARESLG